jgi:hypothetical protein
VLSPEVDRAQSRGRVLSPEADRAQFRVDLAVWQLAWLVPRVRDRTNSPTMEDLGTTPGQSQITGCHHRKSHVVHNNVSDTEVARSLQPSTVPWQIPATDPGKGGSHAGAEIFGERERGV